MLLNSQNAVVGWLPISTEMMGPLRDTGALNAIYRAVSQSNAAAAIIVHGGELDETGNLPAGLSAGKNIAAALAKIDVRPLDSINAVTRQSRAEMGLDIAGGPVFKRDQPGNAKSLTVAEVRRVLKSALDNLTIPHQLHESVEAARGSTGYDIPDDAKGFYFKGELHLIAQGMQTALDAEETFWHEVKHAGLDALYGAGSKAYENALRSIALKNRNIREAAKAWMDKYGQDDYEARIAMGATPQRAKLRTNLQSLEEALAQLSGTKGAKINGLTEFL